MPEVKETTESYFADFAQLDSHIPGVPPWLRELRKQALEQFAESGFPTTRHEAWRFTSVSKIANARWRAPTAPEPPAERVALAAVEREFIKGVAARIVFVDGIFTPHLSALEDLPDGLRVISLETALARPSDHLTGLALENQLARHASVAENPFVALNTAFLSDGAFIQVAPGVEMQNPVHVLYLRGSESAHTVTHPRILMITGHHSRIAVIETYASVADESYFTNAVTEVVAGEESAVEHLKLQEEAESAFHVGTVQAVQERSSRFLGHSVSLGAALARHDIVAVLAGEGGECTLNGLFQVTGRQHVDHHTCLDHAQAHCSSREYYRGILDGRSVGVFNGAILVRKDAQKTDAIQSNKNLLLSEEAVINTKPELQILADDVRCTHGATVGQLDPEALFYLRARGIGLEAARHLLIRAFANEVLGRISFAPVRQRLEDRLLARLSQGWTQEGTL
jgi:Fe-S cluster assembly protein SufD